MAAEFDGVSYAAYGGDGEPAPSDNTAAAAPDESGFDAPPALHGSLVGGRMLVSGANSLAFQDTSEPLLPGQDDDGDGDGETHQWVTGSHDDYQSKGDVGWIRASAMCVASIVGIAVLAMPRAMSKLGWVVGIFVILFFAFVEVYSGVMLARCFDATHKVTGRKPSMYAHLGEAAFGERGRRWVSYGQYSYLWSFCVVVQLVAAKNLTYVISSAGGEGCLVVSHVLVVCAMLPPLQFRTLASITKLATVGVIMIVLVLIIYYSQLGTGGASSTSAGVPESTTFADAMVQVMVIAFAFQGQGVYPEVQATMRKPIDFEYSTILASISLSVIYAATGIFGYDIIGQNSPWLYEWAEKSNGHEIRTPIAAAFLVIHVLCGYVISASVINQALAREILPPNPSNKEWFLLTLATEASYFVVANVTPALSDLLSFAGATCGMMLMTGFSAAFALKLLGSGGLDTIGSWEERLHCAVLVATVVLMVLGIYASGVALSNANWSFKPFGCSQPS